MTSETVIIRAGTAADDGLIAELSRQTFYDSFAEFNTPENMNKFMKEQFSVEQLKEEVRTPGNYFLLAFAGAQCVGYVKLKTSEGSTEKPGPQAIEIARIYAVQQQIGRGVGKSLMEAAIGFAREIQKNMVWLGVWEHNLRAIRFYQKWGFVKFGEHLFMLGDDPQTDWLMKKSLVHEETPMK